MDAKALDIVENLRQEIRDFKLAMNSRIPKDTSIRTKIAASTYLSSMTNIILDFTSVVKVNALQGRTPHPNITAEKMLEDWAESKQTVQDFFDTNFPLKEEE